jgi:hypothetical protein
MHRCSAKSKSTQLLSQTRCDVYGWMKSGECWLQYIQYHNAAIRPILPICDDRHACYSMALNGERRSTLACDHVRLAIDAAIGIACEEWQTAWFCRAQPLVFPHITTRDDLTGGTSQSHRLVALAHQCDKSLTGFSQSLTTRCSYCSCFDQTARHSGRQRLVEERRGGVVCLTEDLNRTESTVRTVQGKLNTAQNSTYV